MIKLNIITGLICILSSTTLLANSEHNVNFQIAKAQNSDDYIATLSTSIQVTDDIHFNALVDNTGYLEVGAGYSFYLPSTLIEPYASYGRADIVDITQVGVFAATPLSDKLSLFANTAHQSRTPQFDILGSGQREWTNSIGFNYQPINWAATSYTFRHDRLLSGNWAVENANINNHELRLTYQQSKIQPYAQYTYGAHRVSPSQPITKESSVEFGLNFNF